jgi:hypothetical protein
LIQVIIYAQSNQKIKDVSQVILIAYITDFHREYFEKIDQSGYKTTFDPLEFLNFINLVK